MYSKISTLGVKFISSIICFLILGISFSYATSSSSTWNTPIIKNELEFSAFLDPADGKVYISWKNFYDALNVNEDFKYYKVVRSSSVASPVYPDNGYIKYEKDINKTNYVDSHPKSGVNYYRVCAMTYANNRYCSNVVKITVNSDSSSKTETITNSTSGGWNTPIIKNELNFSASLDPADGKVYISWKSFYDALNVNEDFKYYKVVRSSSVASPVYPDNGYIKYEKDINKTTYVDSHPKSGVNYYRVCAMTYANNRYCSNVVKITVDSNSSSVSSSNTYSNKISASIQIRANNTLNNFYQKLEKKYSSNEKRLYIMERVITKLENLKKTKPNLANIIDFMIGKMNTQKEKYKDDFGDLENIFNDF